MKKRIFYSSLRLIIACVLILSVVLSLLFFNSIKKNERSALKEYATLISSLLDSGLSGIFDYSDYINRDPRASRMTVLSPDGTVLLDSWAFADRLENHSDRPEFIQALRTGSGEAFRYSDTLQASMYYYAVRLQDGNVLRIYKPVSDVSHVFTILLPVVICVTVLIILLSVYAAHRLTGKIIKPLESLDFDNESAEDEVYDELAPYMKRIEQQKREISEKLSALAERADTIEAITGNMQEGLILINSKAETLMANKSARRIFARELGSQVTVSGDTPDDQLEHKSILRICRDLDFSSAISRCLDGSNAEIRMERGGRIYSVYMSPVFSGGAARGAVILFQDATEKHQAEQQRRQFSANVSHELKTPLTTISALSEMIGSGIARDSDVKGFAERITEQSGRLLLLIDDIIRLSEFDEGGVAMEYTEFSLNELAGTVISAFSENKAGVRIELTGEQFSVSANRRMIDELLYNLIDNGVKYNIAGGSVTVDLSRTDEGMCVIAVSDTGIGISEVHQEHIFERFYRVDKSRSKKTGGTGLGLSIVKHISEYHGGKVEVQSSVDEGTTITCYIRGAAIDS